MATYKDLSLGNAAAYGVAAQAKEMFGLTKAIKITVLFHNRSCSLTDISVSSFPYPLD